MAENREESTKSGESPETTPATPSPVMNRAATARVDHLYRFAEVDSASADDDERMIQVAFSSETPVARVAGKTEEALGIAKSGEKYLEVLSHDEGDADFSDLNRDGAPVLDEHKDSMQIGNVKKAKLSKDRRGRAVLKFDGVTNLSKTRYEQMKTGSRPNISFGYVQTRFVGDMKLADGRKAKRIAFAADEISSVARPADANVGARRSADDKWSCLGCGEMFKRDDLDENFECTDCLGTDRSNMKTKAKPDDFKFKRSDGTEISFNDLNKMVQTAAGSDDRFKKDSDTSYYGPWVTDIIQSGDEWKAIICGPKSKYFEVAFTIDKNTVTLGDSIEVTPRVQYEPAARGAGEHQTRTETVPTPATDPVVKVDSLKLATADEVLANLPEPEKNILRKKLMPIETDEKKLRAELEPQIRTTVETEHRTRSEAATKKIRERNQEINALADEYVKTHGKRWNGPSGQVFVVGERIRSLQMEAQSAPEDHDASEVRLDFKRKVNEAIEGSRAPKNQEEAASLPEEIANRCSLRSIYNGAAKAQERGIRVGAWMPTEGAEFEADKELRSRARDFPGGMAVEMAGICLPVNMPSHYLRSSRRIRRMTRDSLAGDFPTAGALIAPEYKFPTIELLRNKMALGRAGITILGGVIGNLVLPRQTAPTQSQSVAEGQALNQFDQVFDQIRMAPHRIGSSQKYSRLALLQTTEDFEALVMNDHMAQNALRADYLGVNGSGANDEPVGILNQVGIGVVTFGGSAANAYKNIIALETAIRSANIDEEPTYMTTSTARGTLRVTPATLTGSTVVSGESNALWVGEELVGRPAVDSQQIPNSVLVALVGRHLVMAQWGGWQVVLDTLTLADQDKIKLSMNTYIDYALRHPQAVARSADSIAVLT